MKLGHGDWLLLFRPRWRPTRPWRTVGWRGWTYHERMAAAWPFVLIHWGHHKPGPGMYMPGWKDIA